jgi:hypothetical protein
LKQIFPGVKSGIAASSGAAADLQLNTGMSVCLYVYMIYCRVYVGYVYIVYMLAIFNIHYIYVYLGDMVTFGSRSLRCVNTPGHTAVSVVVIRIYIT